MACRTAALVAMSLLLFGCTRSTPAPAASPTPAVAPVSFTTTSGVMLRADLDARCAQLLPGCQFPALVEIPIADPCPYSGGAACPPEVDARAYSQPRPWSCVCDACRTDADCTAGEHCRSSADDCAPTRTASRCVNGPRTPAIPDSCLGSTARPKRNEPNPP